MHSNGLLRFDVIQEYTLPLLQKRYRYPQAFLEAWDEIMKQVNNISVLVNDLSPGDPVWRWYDLYDAFDVYEDVVTRNLFLQEPVAVLLFHAFFSKAEGDKIVKEELRRVSSHSRGLDAVIYYSSLEGDVAAAAKAMPWMFSLEIEYRRRSYEGNVVNIFKSLQKRERPKIHQTAEKTIGFARSLFSAMGADLTKEL